MKGSKNDDRLLELWYMGAVKLPVKIYREVGLKEMWDLQEEHRALILDGKAQSELWLVEHAPTLSLGRAEKGANLLAAKEFIEEQGLEIAEINRGGMITYHGPGQIVAYPILDLKQFKLGIRDYVCKLEQTMIDTLDFWTIQASRKKGAPGVYIDGDRKIGSVGIHIRKQVTIHGLALNIDPIMEHFAFIKPCGLDGIEMTSVLDEGYEADWDSALEPFAAAFEKNFNVELIPAKR
ncbi:MAG: lipoyl(octanoyl) transferase LipB [Bdellovibrionota bacterium]